MVQFANFLNINDLSDSELHELLTSAYAFRDGKQVTLKRPVFTANLFLKTVHGHTAHFKWQNNV